MRIIFITKPFVVEMLGIGYLAASLKKEGHDVMLLHDSDIYPTIRNSSPCILAYSTTTGMHEYYLKFNREMKRRGMVSVFGGAHPTYFPEMANEEGVDYIIRGEGEKSFVELARNFRNRDWMKGEKVLGPVSLIQDLDSIPFPDREFLYTYPENRNNPIKNVMTSRGCPFSCPYCFNSLYKKMYSGQKFVRYRSPDNVIQECVELKKYPLKLIFFQDDELIMNPKFFELMDKYGSKVEVPFHAQLRVEWLTEEKVIALKKAGCKSVTFAIESGNIDIRTKVLKRNISNAQVFDGVQLLKKHRIMFRTENMVGIPGETLGTMLETYDLNRKVNPTIGWCSLFQPYPNLPLSIYAKEKGYWDGKINLKESFFEETVLKWDRKEEIENLQRLFGFGVTLRIPTWAMKLLIKLPKNSFFNWLSKWFKNERYKLLYGLED